MSGRSAAERRQLLVLVGVLLLAVVVSAVVLVLTRDPDVDDVLRAADVQDVPEGCQPGSVERLSVVLDASLVLTVEPQREALGPEGSVLFRVVAAPFDVRPGSTASREPGDVQRATGVLPEAAYATVRVPTMMLLRPGDGAAAPDELLLAMVDGQPYDAAGCPLITDAKVSRTFTRLVEAAADAAAEASEAATDAATDAVTGAPSPSPSASALDPADVQTRRAAGRHDAVLAWRREAESRPDGDGPLQAVVDD